jgi:hypothetical protein
MAIEPIQSWLTKTDSPEGGHIWRRDSDTYYVEHPLCEYAVDCCSADDARVVLDGLRMVANRDPLKDFVPSPSRLTEEQNQELTHQSKLAGAVSSRAMNEMFWTAFVNLSGS